MISGVLTDKSFSNLAAWKFDASAFSINSLTLEAEIRGLWFAADARHRCGRRRECSIVTGACTDGTTAVTGISIGFAASAAGYLEVRGYY